jgi:hypothetical protein
MKKITHIDGLSGKEEFLALKELNKLPNDPTDIDDDGCNEDSDPLEKFNEQSYLEECAYSTYGEI